ncbi:MAG: S-methyl-5-thioribose-1-phosphate isomerase [Candidatus Micrarchaeota archaeon]
MKIIRNGRRRDMKSIWYDRGLKLIDQTLLPEKLLVKRLDDERGVAEAIRSMRVRGAPAIGVAGAYGVAIAAKKGRARSAARLLKAARPTAVDLKNCVDEVLGEKSARSMMGKADEICERVVGACKKIGEDGEKLIGKQARILTHCNAGALATVDWGTALAPIRVAQRKGKKPFVFVDETRPRLQGALTSWELLNEGIRHRVIVDNARGYFMRRGEIDSVIVGADRVVVNEGCIVNKIGTYGAAVIAKENNIPFYVAAPLTTFDWTSGKSDVKIEERSEREVLGIDVNGRGFPKKAKAFNPAFDITPAKYITRIICEKGVYKPEDLRMILSD